jgi:uroporphyrinogen-III decarboxylase
MTSRERVEATVRGLPVDRVPVMTWLDAHAACQMMAEFQPVFTLPHLKKHIEAIHEVGALAMLHSCGYQMPFLPQYVEAELDILQAFQPGAGNDFEKAYKEFGDRLTFCTGVDVQRGARMTPEELRDHILRAYRVGGRNGRHILGYAHMLQYTMPAENMRTILRTVREIQQGLHDGGAA